MQVKTKNLIVGTLCVLLVGLLWYRVVYSPMESKASKAKAAAHDATVTANNLRQAIDGTTSDNNKKKTADISSQQMLAAIPANVAEASFLRKIDTLRIISGAGFQSVTPSAPVPAGNLTTINVAIQVQGTEAEIATYIAGLDSLQRVFIVDNVSITQGTQGGDASQAQPVGHPGAVFFGDQFQMQIAGRIFSQPAAIAPATTPGATGTASTPAAPASGATAPPSPTGVTNG